MTCRKCRVQACEDKLSGGPGTQPDTARRFLLTASAALVLLAASAVDRPVAAIPASTSRCVTVGAADAVSETSALGRLVSIDVSGDRTIVTGVANGSDQIIEVWSDDGRAAMALAGCVPGDGDRTFRIDIATSESADVCVVASRPGTPRRLVGCNR